jgi:hypothetical protein
MHKPIKLFFFLLFYAGTLKTYGNKNTLLKFILVLNLNFLGMWMLYVSLGGCRRSANTDFLTQLVSI